MKNNQARYPYGNPRSTSGLLALFSLGWLSIFAFLAITNGSGDCSGLAMILPGLGLLIATGILVVISIPLFIRYSRTVHYLNSNRQNVPKSYIATLILLPIALFSFFWIPPIVGQIDRWSASAEMNTLDEFRTLARDCKLKTIDNYYNDYHHKATDSNAYIVARSDDYRELFYSYVQKEELQRIYVTEASTCSVPARDPVAGAVIDSSEKYKEIWPSDEIRTYTTSC